MTFEEQIRVWLDDAEKRTEMVERDAEEARAKEVFWFQGFKSAADNLMRRAADASNGRLRIDEEPLAGEGVSILGLVRGDGHGIFLRFRERESNVAYLFGNGPSMVMNALTGWQDVPQGQDAEEMLPVEIAELIKMRTRT